MHAEADTSPFTNYESIWAYGYVKPFVIDTEDIYNYSICKQLMSATVEPGEISVKEETVMPNLFVRKEILISSSPSYP